MTKKRDLFNELTEGFDALVDHRTGKRTLRTHAVKVKPAPKITARELTRVREQMNVSRGLFAGYSHKCTDARELGAGARQAECAGGTADTYAAAIPGHRAPLGRDLMAAYTGHLSPIC